MADNKFAADYDKRGRAGCKKCKEVIGKDSLRIAKVTPNPFGEDSDMKQYYHVDCIFDSFQRARATTKVIEDITDVNGFEHLKEVDKITIQDSIESK